MITVQGTRCTVICTRKYLNFGNIVYYVVSRTNILIVTLDENLTARIEDNTLRDSKNFKLILYKYYINMMVPVHLWTV